MIDSMPEDAGAVIGDLRWDSEHTYLFDGKAWLVIDPIDLGPGLLHWYLRSRYGI